MGQSKFMNKCIGVFKLAQRSKSHCDCRVKVKMLYLPRGQDQTTITTYFRMF